MQFCNFFVIFLITNFKKYWSFRKYLGNLHTYLVEFWVLESSVFIRISIHSSTNSTTKILNFVLVVFVIFEIQNIYFWKILGEKVRIEKFETEIQNFGTGVCWARHAD